MRQKGAGVGTGTMGNSLGTRDCYVLSVLVLYCKLIHTSIHHACATDQEVRIELNHCQILFVKYNF